MPVSDDLATMLRDELAHIDDEQRALDDRRAAALLLLGTPAPMPVATFSAVDAAAHVERQAAAKPKRNGREGLRAKLTAKEIATIRDRASKGETAVEIAADYSVSRSTIGNIVARKGCYA